MGQEARGYISRQRPGSILNNKGTFYASSEAIDVMSKVGEVIQGIASSSDSIRFPLYKEERSELIKQLIDAYLDKSPVKIIAPACPDYGEGQAFHSRVGSGIGKEAEAAIRATMALDSLLVQSGIDFSIEILVADTEGDHEDILRRCSGGDLVNYLGACNRSSLDIASSVEGLHAQASTFTQRFGNLFPLTQYAYERLIKAKLVNDNSFKEEVARIGESRKNRHLLILDREEIDFELTLRYMAQYAALGSIARDMDTPVMFLNYDTPNRLYYNAGFFRGITLSQRDQTVIPVLGTVVKR